MTDLNADWGAGLLSAGADADAPASAGEGNAVDEAAAGPAASCAAGADGLFAQMSPIMPPTMMTARMMRRMVCIVPNDSKGSGAIASLTASPL